MCEEQGVIFFPEVGSSVMSARDNADRGEAAVAMSTFADHKLRASMGHRLQVELRDSMERYHGDRDLLQQHLAQLKFRSRRLHTSPPPPLPEDKPPLNKWGDPSSSFSKAPEAAAQKARLAQLQEENARNVNAHKTDDKDNPQGNNSLLPPIQENGAKNSTPGEQTSSPDGQTAQNETTKKPTPASKKPAPKMSLQEAKKAYAFKGGKFQKKPLGGKKPAQPKEKLPLPLLRLPTIHSVTPRNSMWDSGCNHTHPTGPSTHLEKNQVDEECRLFRQPSRIIPPIADTRRTEIQRPPGGIIPPLQREVSKVQFRRHVDKVEQSNAPPLLRQQSTVDHFPQNTPRLPELEGSSDGEESDDGKGEPSRDRVAGIDESALPAVIPLSVPSNQPLAASQTVPRLRLQRGMTPSAVSTNTARSGATYMSLMSQETQEWKGAYMMSDDPHHKSRMLVEILHATRQRMHDNEEDLCLTGDLPSRPLHDPWGSQGRSDFMLVHRGEGVATESGETTARSTGSQQKPLKLPHHKKRAAGESRNSKLHRYLTKLSSQRRGGGDNRHHRDQGGPPFHLAATTIREITQTSIDHSAVQTAS